jgi:acyl-CoA thioester hydrolase
MLEVKNTHQLYVRYAETDKMGVVYHANYYIYFETGRNELMRKYGITLVEYEAKDNVFFPLIDCYAKFLSPAHYDDLLTIETILVFDGLLSFRFDYVVRRGDLELCQGYTRHCFINQKTMKPVRPPKELITALENS